MNIIYHNPGIRYRELLRLTNSSNGVLSYHIPELVSSKNIKIDRRRGVTRYYPVHITLEISKIISNIRSPVSRHILSLLAKNGPCTLSEIATSTNKAPSTISWYLQRLMNANVVRRKSARLNNNFYKSKYYDFSDKKLILGILSKYLEDPLNELVYNYSEMMNELAE